MLRPAIAVLAVLAVLPLVPAQEPPSDPALGWRVAAERSGITGKDLETLAREELLLTNEGFKAVFDPYLSGPDHLSSFITSDSLLAGYHSLFEESVIALETARAGKLPTLLADLQEYLADETSAPQGSVELVAAARRRLRLVLAVAQALIGPLPPSVDAETARTIAPVVAALQQSDGGTARIAPEWLGPYDGQFLGIDVGHCRPRGPYAEDPLLARYFQACAWLQAVPFRVDQDVELLGVCLLGDTISDHRFGGYDEFTEFFGTFESIIGRRDDWDLPLAIDTMRFVSVDDEPVAAILAETRAGLRKRAEKEGL